MNERMTDEQVQALFEDDMWDTLLAETQRARRVEAEQAEIIQSLVDALELVRAHGYTQKWVDGLYCNIPADVGHALHKAKAYAK